MSEWIVTRLRRNGPTHVLSADGRYVAQRVTPDFLPLVAAAPEMLEALRSAVQAMRAPLDEWKGEMERKALDAANAAIAKAEGRA